LITTPEPSALERCEVDLRAVASLMARWVSSPEPTGAGDRAALKNLQTAVRRLGVQVEQGSNLCSGWAQIRLAAGYSGQGKPIFVAAESTASYEG
jgi:hypothetical protein